MAFWVQDDTTTRYINNIMDVCYYSAHAENSGKIITIGSSAELNIDDQILYKTKSLVHACEFVFYLNRMRIDYYTTLTQCLPVIYRLAINDIFVNYSLGYSISRQINVLMLIFESKKLEITANWVQEGF